LPVCRLGGERRPASGCQGRSGLLRFALFHIKDDRVFIAGFGKQPRAVGGKLYLRLARFNGLKGEMLYAGSGTGGV
jgi:hypothetical protein